MRLLETTYLTVMTQNKNVLHYTTQAFMSIPFREYNP